MKGDRNRTEANGQNTKNGPVLFFCVLKTQSRITDYDPRTQVPVSMPRKEKSAVRLFVNCSLDRRNIVLRSTQIIGGSNPFEKNPHDKVFSTLERWTRLQGFAFLSSNIDTEQIDTDPRLESL